MNSVIPEFTIRRAVLMLQSNKPLDQISETLSLEPAVVRFIEREWIDSLINSNGESGESVETIRQMIDNAEYDIPEPEAQRLLNDRQILSRSLAIFGFTIPQIHVVTKVTMSTIRRIVHEIRNSSGKISEDQEVPLPAMPNNLATRLINSIFIAQYNKAKRLIHSEWGINSLIDGDITEDSELSELVIATIAWIATRAEVESLKLKDTFEQLRQSGMRKDFRFSDGYLSLGTLYPTIESLNLGRSTDVEDSLKRFKKLRLMRTDRCSNKRCGAQFVFFSDDKKEGAECPFCEFQRTLKTAFAKASSNKKQAPSADPRDGNEGIHSQGRQEGATDPVQSPRNPGKSAVNISTSET